jgi:hypothetical protein
MELVPIQGEPGLIQQPLENFLLVPEVFIEGARIYGRVVHEVRNEFVLPVSKLGINCPRPHLEAHAFSQRQLGKLKEPERSAVGRNLTAPSRQRYWAIRAS